MTEENGPPPIDHRRMLILGAALIAVVVATLMFARGDGSVSAYGFGGVAVMQLLAMLRGASGDRQINRKIDQRLNGEMDQRIRRAAAAAVADAMDDTLADLRREMHSIKHDMKGLHTTHRMIEELLQIASGRQTPPRPPAE